MFVTNNIENFKQLNTIISLLAHKVTMVTGGVRAVEATSKDDQFTLSDIMVSTWQQ